MQIDLMEGDLARLSEEIAGVVAAELGAGVVRGVLARAIKRAGVPEALRDGLLELITGELCEELGSAVEVVAPAAVEEVIVEWAD